MNSDMTVLSWNVNGENGASKEKVNEQIELIGNLPDQLQPDVVMLQAVYCEDSEDTPWHEHLERWVTGLASIGLSNIVHSLDWAHELHQSTIQPQQDITGFHNRGNLIASSYDLDRVPLSVHKGCYENRQMKNFATLHPDKLLRAQLDRDETSSQPIDLWNVGIVAGSIIGDEKLHMLETLYRRVYVEREDENRPTLIAGDFNGPKKETSEGKIIPHGDNKPKYTSYPWYSGENTFQNRWKKAEKNIFDSEFSEWDIKDAYWSQQDGTPISSTEDYTHEVSTGNPSKKRLDHILTSHEIDVQECRILNGKGSDPNFLKESDHAAVVSKVSL